MGYSAVLQASPDILESAFHPSNVPTGTMGGWGVFRGYWDSPFARPELKGNRGVERGSRGSKERKKGADI